ncbi:MAG TPA: hypothetical protein VJH65_03955 [Candidatus Nanoarchaeia archaeon]|nr:hypothetical protein [Candidatus Nanoarchaeia archaeon]
MEKRNLLFALSIISGLFLISLVSAQYGYYGRFSISEFIASIDPSDLFIVLVFIASFALLNWALGRVIDNKATSGVIAFSISFGITYGINRMGWDIERLFFSFGISEGFLYGIGVIIFIGLFLYLRKKFGAGLPLIGLGAMLFLMAIFTDWIYEKGLVTIIGVVMIIIGAIFYKKKKPQNRGYTSWHD